MSEISENQKTKLSFKTVNGSEKEFDCEIKKVYNDRISLNFPKELINYAAYLQEGDEVNVKIFTQLGIKIFNAMILNSPLEHDFVIESVENYIEIQRRKYARTDVKTKIIIERGEGDEKRNIVTQTLDISGGGVRFLYEDRFAERETVSCYLYLPMELHSVKATGMILKDQHLPKDEHVLLFTKIEEKDRDKIIKKCFEIEAKQKEI